MELLNSLNYKNVVKHVETIKKLVKTIRNSENFHGCIVEGPAGWGKTTSVEAALSGLGESYISLGSYSTPLCFFNFLGQHPSEIVLLDDVSGLFSSPLAMAILKSATWPRHSTGERVIKWGSTSMRVELDEFVFNGKLLIICNSFPKTADAEAIRSRCLSCKIHFSNTETEDALLEASRNKKWFKRTIVAVDVAKYLISRLEFIEGSVSYRTLKMGYELALHNEDWRELLAQIIPQKKKSYNPKEVVTELNTLKLPVEKQLVEFERRTGLKRRSFYKIRKELNFSRPYKEKVSI